jgi:D-3-phosphoglycerate dehydrogenase
MLAVTSRVEMLAWGRRRVKIVLASPIAEEAVETLRIRHDIEISWDDFGAHRFDRLADRECLIFRSGVEMSADMIDLMPQLELIVRAGSGFDNIDLDHARARDIRVVRIPGPAAQAVAEFTFSLMLSLARNVSLADRLLREGHWPKRELGGNLLTGKTLGVVGAGNIGGRVGELGAAWGMTVLGCVGDAEAADIGGYAERGIQITDLDTVVTSADFVTVHTPLDPTTRGLIGSQELDAMKPGAFLINTARGGVVDEGALFDTLESGHLAGAALDVHEDEGEGIIPDLASLPNVVLTPHIGGMAIESQAAIGRRLLELIDAYLAGALDDEANPTEIIV